MAESPEFKPIQCLCTNLKKTSRLVARVYDAALESTGINAIQYSILMNVYKYQPLALPKLAERLDMERTTLYRALDILEKHGFVKITEGDEGVTKYVSLTADGKSVTLKAEAKWKKIQDEFVDENGVNRLNQINKMLSEIREHFK